MNSDKDSKDGGWASKTLYNAREPMIPRQEQHDDEEQKESTDYDDDIYAMVDHPNTKAQIQAKAKRLKLVASRQT